MDDEQHPTFLSPRMDDRMDLDQFRTMIEARSATLVNLCYGVSLASVIKSLMEIFLTVMKIPPFFQLPVLGQIIIRCIVVTSRNLPVSSVFAPSSTY